MSHAVVSLPSPQLSLSLSVQKSQQVKLKSAFVSACRGNKCNSPVLKFNRVSNRQPVYKFVIPAKRVRLNAIRGFICDEKSGVSQEESLSGFSVAMEIMMRKMPKGGTGVLMKKEKFKLVIEKPVKQISPKLADSGGGGDIGKKNSHGGGDGGDDGGDDDDYFGDFDEGDEGDEGGWFRRRTVFQEVFDRTIIEAVLREWHRTMSDLPAGLLQACEMGLVSTAQVVRYLSINARPTVSRFISRATPQTISRAFVGRMIADPAFLPKMLLEQVTTICSTTWWELRHRKERIKHEWDLALINVLTASVCNAAIVWTLAPCRSYGTTFRFNLQNTLQKLPNNIFERNYPLREFDLQKRIHCFFYKAAELCMVGMAAGAANGALSNLCASQKEGRTSVLIPSVSTSSLGYGAFLGLSGNLRYQLLNGMERVIHDRFDVIGAVICFSSALRMLNIQLGDVTRLVWLGLDVDPLFEAGYTSKDYNRPTQKALSNWFIAQKNILSGLFGGKQESMENVQDTSTPSRVPRRRIVKRKVTARS
ncbi:protein RETICULATA-RELATED 1, chloroplastic [Cryptomeria japonica]|uniref:protein RETICULATA-RELATED 1, chloroplastic n=1 Tax=Cryptomeria japonica TaxID=3369 RepID=UPI0027DA80E5|nr:protein RETICULATA-RELATED 1, chloroplastic [Cryptomeria japonica]XP_057850084.2 protein RETICULATA-RELATED 1, chloroplastic [Cryptomeria japonica]